MDAAAQAATQAAANRRLNETISDLPKFYGSSKDTVSTNIENNNLCYIEVENCSPCDIKLERGSTIETVESEWEDQIQEFDGKQIDNFINEIRETTSKAQKPIYLTRDEIEKHVKMNIPAAHKDKYLDLLYKLRSVISKTNQI